MAFESEVGSCVLRQSAVVHVGKYVASAHGVELGFCKSRRYILKIVMLSPHCACSCVFCHDQNFHPTGWNVGHNGQTVLSKVSIGRARLSIRSDRPIPRPWTLTPLTLNHKPLTLKPLNAKPRDPQCNNCPRPKATTLSKPAEAAGLDPGDSTRKSCRQFARVLQDNPGRGDGDRGESGFWRSSFGLSNELCLS